MMRKRKSGRGSDLTIAECESSTFGEEILLPNGRRVGILPPSSLARIAPNHPEHGGQDGGLKGEGFPRFFPHPCRTSGASVPQTRSDEDDLIPILFPIRSRGIAGAKSGSGAGKRIGIGSRHQAEGHPIRRLTLSGRWSVANIRRQLRRGRPTTPHRTCILSCLGLLPAPTGTRAEAWRTHGGGFARRGEGRESA